MAEETQTRTAFLSKQNNNVKYSVCLPAIFFFLSPSSRLPPRRKDTQPRASTNECDVPVWSTRISDACRRPTPKIPHSLHHPELPDDIVAPKSTDIAPWLHMRGDDRFVFFRRRHNINLIQKRTYTSKSSQVNILIIPFFPQ